MKAFYSSAIWICVFFVNVVCFQNTYAQNKNHSAFNIKPFERKAFIENKGQFNSQLPSDKQNFYYCVDKGYQIFFYNNTLTYRFQKITHRKEKLRDVLKSEERREELEHEMNREEQFIQVEWLNTNPNATIEVSEKSTTIYSYLLKDKNQTNYTQMCEGYSKLTYKNLYTGIDVEYIFHPTEGIKYNIIASVGADLSQIKLKYTGQKSIEILNGEVHIKTIIGDIIEKQPVSYHSNNSSNSIPSSYTLQNNILSFDIRNSSTNNITIDPWVVVPGTSGNVAYDNGTDAFGNNYIYGGSLGSFTVEKYASTGGAALWSFASSSVIDASYYGDMLVESTGNFYLCEGYVGGGAHTYKFSPSSSSIWTSGTDGNFREHWRLALDCKTGRVIVAGGGTTSPTLNIAEINLTTGALVNAKSVYSGSQSDVAGLCVDGTGKAYLKHSNPNIVTFTDNANNTLANIFDGYALSEIAASSPSYYGSNFANGYNMMALAGTSFLFTCDGATIKKWNCATFAIVSSVTIPGASAGLGSGILVDECNNLFIGTNIGVFRYDFNLAQQEFHAAPAAVYDIAFSPTGEIIASGKGFLTNIIFSTPPCIFQTAPISASSCGGGATGFIKLNLTGGVVPYNYIWSGNGLVANTDSVGGLAPGTYKCVFTDSPCNNPHKDSITITILPLPIPTASFSANPVCLTSASSFTNLSTVASPGTIASWAWDFDNNGTIDSTSKNPTTTYTAVGSHPVKLKVTSNNGCKDSTVISVMVNPNPTATFTPVSACTNANVLLNNTSTIPLPDNISNYNWLFGTASSPLTSSSQNPPSLTYSLSGVKTITLSVTSNNNCSSTFTQTVTINPLPASNFSATAVCQATATTFTDLSTVSSGSITAWAWDYTHNGSVDNNTQNPTFTYPASGIFTVGLQATTNFGCANTFTLPINVWGHATVNYASTNACFNTANTFTNTSTTTLNANTGSINTYTYSFGDGGLSNLPNTSHTYVAISNATVNTNYTVSLTVTTNHSCVDSISKVITVYALPIASFTADSVCLNMPSHLVNASLGNGNPVTGYHWDYTNDNIPEVNGVSNPNYIFTSSGNNIVNYTVTTSPMVGLVCSSYTTQNVWVNPLPQPAFTFTNACINAQPLSFDGSGSTIAIGSNTSYDWAFGDGAVASGSVNTHPYALPSTYNVTLTVTSNKGCQAILAQQIEVYKKPLMQIAVNSICLGGATSFTAVSLANSGNVTSWLWDVNNSVSTIERTGQQNSYTYPAAGSQTLQLISITNYNCKDTTTRLTYVNYNPTPQFSVDKPNGCPLPHCVKFTDNSSPVPLPAHMANWAWDFGNGKTVSASTNAQQNNCYTNSSSSQLALYSVTLTTTTDSGCVASNVKPNFITVYPKPIANYTIVPEFGDVIVPLVHFINQSVDYTKWWWSFGDGPKIDSVNVNPNHYYPGNDASSYHSILIVANQYGCRDTANVLVEIAPEFSFYIPNAFTPNGDNTNDIFTGMGVGIVTYEMWVFDRWGASIFYTDDIMKGWNGKVQGKSEDSKEDVYTWKVKLKDVLNKNHSYVGHVTLLK